MHSKEEPRVLRMLYVNKLDFSIRRAGHRTRDIKQVLPDEL